MATTGVILLFRPSLCNHGSVAIVTPPRFAQVHIHMQNPNFVAVTVNSLNVSVMHDLTMAGTTMKTGLTLPLLSDATVRVGTGVGVGGGARRKRDIGMEVLQASSLFQVFLVILFICVCCVFPFRTLLMCPAPLKERRLYVFSMWCVVCGLKCGVWWVVCGLKCGVWWVVCGLKCGVWR